MAHSRATVTAPTARRAGLDRDDVVGAALALVEAEGADALTMRRLAAELEVTTTTIYWHVGHRDDLVLAVIARLADRQAAATVRGSTPRERVVSAARNIWTNALAHRNVTALASQVGATTLLELPLEVALVAELESAGVRGPAARDVTRSILACVAGFLVLAWRAEERVPPELRWRALWAGVDDDRISPVTLEVLGEPPDLDALVDATLTAVVAAALPVEPDVPTDRTVPTDPVPTEPRRRTP
jgi:TetR/AcrR family tetracycline transcriptional repressor